MLGLKRRPHMQLCRIGRIATIVVLASLTAAPFGTAEAVQLVPVEPSKFEWSTSRDKPGLRVIVDRPMTVKHGGVFSWFSPMTLEKGVYKDLMQIRLDGRDFVLVRSDISKKIKRADLGDLGACYQREGEYFVIDVETGDVLDRMMLRNRVISPCKEGTKVEWHWKLGSISDPGEFSVVWGQSYLNEEAREKSSERLKAEQAAKIDADAAIARNDATRVTKQMIGTTLCRWDGGVQYIGYTENVSPDNGKIQIRVAEARLGGTPGLSPGSFKPSIIWNHPDAWELCE